MFENSFAKRNLELENMNENCCKKQLVTMKNFLNSHSVEYPDLQDTVFDKLRYFHNLLNQLDARFAMSDYRKVG